MSKRWVLAFVSVAAIACGPEQVPSPAARTIAARAVASYTDSALGTLANLTAFRTVARPGLANAENPEFRRMSDYLRERAETLGFDFTDHGAVVVIALGEPADRLGLITHGDVQPADSSKWEMDPFTLDTVSEPGRLVARGVDDDKGPIANALWAMKALADSDVPLARRVELIISYTEESDWAPFTAFLQSNPPPELNVALDAEYPLVVAEKAWNAVFLSLPPVPGAPVSGPNRLVSIEGGAFISQIPEDAVAVIAEAMPELEARLRMAARESQVEIELTREGRRLTVRGRGKSAHSSKPWEGVNAITHLAALLGTEDWPDTQSARMVRLINDLVGTGDYGERFGAIAHEHPFMGRLSLSLTVLGKQGDDLVASINIRSPAGREPRELKASVQRAVAGWRTANGIESLRDSVIVSAPHYIQDAPHIAVLLDIFAHYTGAADPQPIAIGGGTHARLVPNGVNFGPAMPGEEYTAHSEHEYVSRDVFVRNLEMYTAMLVELAGG